MTILQWHNTSEEDIDKYTPIVVKSIEEDIDSGFIPEYAEDLIFHHIPLTEEGYEGPLVMVWGVHDDIAYQCEYVDKPEWITLQELDKISYIIPTGNSNE